MTSPYFTQIDFRGYADDGVPGLNTVKAAINADWTQSVDENFRIRFAVEESNNKSANNPVFPMEYNLNFGGWTDLTTISSVVNAVLSPHYVDGGSDNVQRVSSGGTFTGGELDEDATLGEILDFVGNDICEYECCLYITSGDVSNGDSLDIRVKGLGAYTNTPTITISEPTTAPPTTAAPTTLPPTTEAPTTAAPTTSAPTTSAPTTTAPTTTAPTSLAPTTLPPTTLAPTTLLPTTLAPTSLAPTTLPPTTLAPTSLPPTTLAPTSLAPTTLAPTSLAPTTLAPTTLAPTTEPPYDVKDVVLDFLPTTAAPTTAAPTTAPPTTLAPTTLPPTTLAPTTLPPTTLPPTNDFTNCVHCVALWRMENGALTVDSIGTNTLVNTGVVNSVVTYKEGAASAYYNELADRLAINDVDLDNGFPFKSGDTDKDMSICFWVRVTGYPASANRVILIKSSGDPNRSIYVYMSKDVIWTLRFAWSNDGTGWDEEVDFGTAFATDVWYHVGITWDNSSKAYKIRIWDDNAGALLGGDEVTGNGSGEIAATTGSFIIGHNGSSLGSYKDEVVVFKSVITSTDIDNIRQGLFSRVCTTAPPTTLAPTTLAPTTLPPTTLAPTTLAPTTLPPTTLAPTTLPPTTLAPTTLPPTTLAPTTLPPTSLAPTTLPPTSLPPTTLAPTTLAPTTLVPTTLPPTTLEPTTLPPTTLAPTSLAPTTIGPTTLAPTTLPPTTLAPTTLAPTTLPPTTLVPTTLAPTTLAPTTLAPTSLAPTTLAPTTLPPTTLAPTTIPPTTVPPTTLAPTTLGPTTIGPTTLPSSTLPPTTDIPEMICVKDIDSTITKEFLMKSTIADQLLLESAITKEMVFHGNLC